MSRNVVFKPNSTGIKKMLQSSDMEKMVEKEAKKRADGTDEVRTFIGFDRAHAIIEGKR